MKIYNGTPNAVNIIDGAVLDTTDRKYKGGQLVKSMPVDGMLSVTFAVTEGEPVEGIPTFPVMSEDGKTFVGCRGLQLF